MKPVKYELTKELYDSMYTSGEEFYEYAMKVLENELHRREDLIKYHKDNKDALIFGYNSAIDHIMHVFMNPNNEHGAKEYNQLKQQFLTTMGINEMPMALEEDINYPNSSIANGIYKKCIGYINEVICVDGDKCDKQYMRQHLSNSIPQFIVSDDDFSKLSDSQFYPLFSRCMTYVNRKLDMYYGFGNKEVTV